MSSPPRCIFARDRDGTCTRQETVVTLQQLADIAGFGPDDEIADVIRVPAGEWRCELLGGHLAYRLWSPAQQGSATP